MKKTVFATIATSREAYLQVKVLAASIREFAGRLAESQIWVFVPNNEDVIPTEIKKQLLELETEIIPFKVESEVLKFPFASKVLAAATAESLAKQKTELLVCLDPDTIIMSEPKLFLLDEGKNLGYRPVHHTLIGSIYEKPLDPFWELVYRKCEVPEDKIFPMKTHVDENTLRPYFNAGFLIVRPEKGILQRWWDCFKETYRDSSFEEFYKKDERYIIFIHQAVLAGVILSLMSREELNEMPFEYNYPLNLYNEIPVEFHPQGMNSLITARYCTVGLSGLDNIPLQEHLRKWLKEQMQT